MRPYTIARLIKLISSEVEALHARLATLHAELNAEHERTRDLQGLVTERYDLQPGTVYLLRPDQHVSARCRQLDAGWLDAAIRRTLGWIS